MLWLPTVLSVISFLIIVYFDRKNVPLMKIARLNMLYIIENSIVTVPLVSFTILITNIRQRLVMLNKHLRYDTVSVSLHFFTETS